MYTIRGSAPARPKVRVPSHARDFQRAARRRALAAILIGLAFTALATSLWVRSPQASAALVGAVVTIPLALGWLWRRPARGLYVLFAAAVIQETQFSGVSFADDLGAYTPFFQDVATWTHSQNIPFSVAEVWMVLTLLFWLLKGVAAHKLDFRRGTLLRPLGLYMAMVLVGELHGLSGGGDFRLSLWEVRGQVYLLVAYLLTCQLIRSRRQVDLLMRLLLLGAGLKGIQGTVRYLVGLQGHLGGVEAIFPHEQSFFFNAFFCQTAILFLYGGSGRLKRVSLALLPFVALADLANQRRAAILALGVALVLIMALTALAYPPRRRAMIAALLVLGAASIPYYLTDRYKGGLIAQPARALSSIYEPSPRDLSSNTYRVNEDANLLFTMRTSPVIGYGFGKTFLTPYPLADISGSYGFWNLLPHNSILWIWMRIGSVGYLLFWLLIAGALAQAGQLLRRIHDPPAKGVALLILVLIVQDVIVSYLDLQWVNYRNAIVVGVLFALLSLVPRYAAEGSQGESRDEHV